MNDKASCKYPGPLNLTFPLYHDAKAGGFPPVPSHEQLKSSSSFKVTSEEQLTLAVGCTKRKFYQ